MKRKRTDVDYLLDILDNAEKAQRFVQGVQQADFEFAFPCALCYTLD